MRALNRGVLVEESPRGCCAVLEAVNSTPTSLPNTTRADRGDRNNGILASQSLVADTSAHALFKAAIGQKSYVSCFESRDVSLLITCFNSAFLSSVLISGVPRRVLSLPAIYSITSVIFFGVALSLVNLTASTCLSCLWAVMSAPLRGHPLSLDSWTRSTDATRDLASSSAAESFFLLYAKKK